MGREVSDGRWEARARMLDSFGWSSVSEFPLVVHYCGLHNVTSRMPKVDQQDDDDDDANGPIWPRTTSTTGSHTNSRVQCANSIATTGSRRRPPQPPVCRCCHLAS